MTLASAHAKILALITPLYEEIFAMESAFGLWMGGGDHRPRVDYFHDCVRLATSGHTVPVERLGYALAAIRFLSARPLAALQPDPGSPSVALAARPPGALSPQRSLSRAEKAELGELYARYGILFSSFFSGMADRDMRERVDAKDEAVGQLAEVEAALSAMAQGAGKQALPPHLHGVESAALKAALAQLSKRGRQPTPEEISKTAKAVQSEMDARDKEAKAIEDAHLQFASNQLALFEQGKDVVKQLASSGLNLAGQFVAGALVQTNQRGRGR